MFFLPHSVLVTDSICQYFTCHQSFLDFVWSIFSWDWVRQ